MSKAGGGGMKMMKPLGLDMNGGGGGKPDIKSSGGGFGKEKTDLDGKAVGGASKSAASGGAAGDGKDGGSVILFDTGKEPLRTLTAGYKMLHRKLKNLYQITHNKDEISRDKLSGVRCIVFAAPRQKFEQNELNVLKDYLSQGGSILFFGTEGSDDDMKHVNTQINRFITDYGITLESDAVVRTVYRKEYFHPKEVYIRDVAIVPSLDVIAGKKKPGTTSVFDAKEVAADGLAICYPFGATLKIVKPATPLLTSGALSFPSNRPLCAFNRVGNRGGCLMVVGSANVFDDNYISRDDNSALSTALFRLLTEGNQLKVESVDEDRPEYQERIEIPDIEALAERYRSCLQESEELPVDFTTLFDHTLFKLDTNLIPEAVKLYTTLSVKHEPLSLIPPQFDVPLPPLQPAVFMPQMRELPAPALDLFDLDAHFATEKLRLAQLTNKCTTDKDLDYYIKEAAEILAISDAVCENFRDRDAKEPPAYSEISASQVLEFVFKKLVAYKKIEQGGVAPSNAGLGMSADSKERMAANTNSLMLAGSGGGGGGGAARNTSAGSSRTGSAGGPGFNRMGSAGRTGPIVPASPSNGGGDSDDRNDSKS